MLLMALADDIAYVNNSEEARSLYFYIGVSADFGILWLMRGDDVTGRTSRVTTHVMRVYIYRHQTLSSKRYTLQRLSQDA